ncbi:MAG TPA: hypothetical protein VD908_03305 [Cytophagales bacterium]|nr:hypothetical protein [Cytophagales bacterium]
MHKILKAIGFCLLIGSSCLSYGQSIQLTEDPEEFSKNLQLMLAGTNNAEARLTADEFGALWTSGKLSESQRKQLISIGLKMQKRRFKALPGFNHLIGAINAAVNIDNISTGELDKVLAVTEKVLDKQDNNKVVFRYLETMNLLFQKDALYRSNYNSLLVDGGSYSFEYAELAEPATISLDDQPLEEVEESESEDDWGDGWGDDSWDTSSDTGQVSTDYDAVAATTEVIQPPIQGPVIKFDKVNLTVKTNYDSSKIMGTSGHYLFLTETFVGEGGKFDWSAAGLDPAKVYAAFTKYNFKIKSPSIDAEKVSLFYPDMVDQPIEGVFEYKSKKHKGPDDAQYPRFKSYSNNIKVKNIGENLSYVGGFALGGNKVYSSSVNQGLATIKVIIDGVEKFQTTSRKFQLGDSLVEAKRASMIIYQKNDTIVHPAIQLKYNKNSKELTIKRDEGGYKNMPFFASYFKTNFIADVIHWNVKSDSLDIAILGARNQVPAIFASEDYFSDTGFDELKGLYSFHPLQLAVNYSNSTKSRTFYTPDLAAKYRLNPNLVKSAMVELHQRGFVDLNFVTGEVFINDKAIHYTKARWNKKDFDNMLIPSLIASKPNATLNLDKQRMTIRGVDQFSLSDSLNTYIRPTNSEIILLKNRDFLFSGTINSGNFEFYGSNFKFRYDSFVVSMQLIDSIKLTVTFEDENGKKTQRQLDNQLEFSSGILYISDPSNKSSRKRYPQYPIFDATTGAIVYFDGKEINRGAYDRSITFDIPPFRIDSLSASDPATIGFEGTFKSDGMFPEFKERLKVRIDGSLGFDHKIPASGYPLYGGIYKGDADMGSVLSMSEKGLRGGGTIEYLTSTFSSKEFIFYIDSVKTRGATAKVRAGTLDGASYPQITADNYKMTWLPKKDTLLFANIKEPIQLYDNTATLNGRVNLSTKGLFGNGTLVTRGSESVSDYFTFREKGYLGRKAKFIVKTNDPAKAAFQGDDVKLDFNLEENYAKISPEVEGAAALSFPYSKYKSSINEVIWKLDEKKILMSVPEGSDLESSYFYSTRKDQDSLVFNATSAEYDIPQQILNIKGIPYIKVADAKIIPSKGEVSIKENASFQPLTEADLLIDTLNEFHSLYDGNINILSRNKFTGNAKYRFVNTVKDTFSISFDRFELENKDSQGNEIEMQTVSSGTVREEDKLLIAPKMYYKGKTTMYAHRKALELNGFVKLDLDKFEGYNKWIAYKRTEDVDEIVIDFDNNVTDKNEKLVSGVHLDAGTNNMYFTFANSKHKPIDHNVFLGSGMLSYNLESKQFRLINEAKDKGQSFEGNSMTYDEENSLLKFEGKLNLVRDSKAIDVVSAGYGVIKIDSGVYRFNSLLGVNYDIPSKATELMVANLKEVLENTNAAPSTTDRTDLLYRIAAIAGNPAAKTYEEKSATDNIPLSGASPQFLKTVVLSDVNFKWSEAFKSFYSVGKINLSNAMETDLNARINGFIEIRKMPNSGEVFSLYLEATAGTYYFFRFEANKLWVFSSDEDFNDAIASKSKGESVKPGQYTFVLSNMADMLTYINRFRRNYFGIEEPYKFEGTKEQVEEEKVEEVKQDTDDGF